ncbi:MAG: BON domain-containing protein [Methylophilaceae bacterium]
MSFNKLAFAGKPLAGLIIAAALATQLAGCFPVVAGGMVAGGAMAADRRSSGTYIDDQSIELKVGKNIVDNIGSANIHVNVTSYNRSVLLTGEVIDAAAKAKAETVAKSIENVKNVTNELVIDENSKLTERNNDTYITTKVKSRMIKENKFPANYVKVVTEISTVYLMGLVTHKEADDAVEIARGTDGVQKVVKVFEYID